MTHIFSCNLPQKYTESTCRVIDAALSAADPRAAVQRAVRHEDDAILVSNERICLSNFHRIRIVGAGKASQAMAAGLIDVLGDRISDGVIITKHIDTSYTFPEKVKVLRGGHPVPSEESVSSTRALVDLLAYGSPEDLIFFLISGGGSALMTLPVEGVSLEDMQSLTRLLLACGANIGEMNTLRKHLDRVKGGGLAQAAAPARLVTLILSDVIGSPLDVIASGPTVPDTSTYSDAAGILRKYGILERVPPSVRWVIERGQLGEIPETVKPGAAVMQGVTNLVVASNVQAAEAALAQAKHEGLNPMLLTTFLQGEASQAGIFLASLIKQIRSTGHPLERPACIVVGGETTVTLRGKGLGGRNQEIALGSVSLLSGEPDVALVAIGTDGEDGPTDAAGAVVTGDTLWRATEKGLDPQSYLQNNDAYHFFEALDDLVKTGPTGTNVNDLAFLFVF